MFGAEGRIFFRSSFLLTQGEARQVMPREGEEIEDVVEQMADSGFLVILQHLKIGLPPIVHDDDFAVENGLEPELPQRLQNGRKPSGRARSGFGK